MYSLPLFLLWDEVTKNAWESFLIVIQNGYKYCWILYVTLGNVNKNTIFIGPKEKNKYAD
ncbi:hypothetical protein EG344_22065 [Chryseobacterium sp. G0162]|nr:hypothetical protein EG344_22065 [Chryseobacterium sp. G0162]